MTRLDFNKDFICRYLPDRKQKSKHELISFDTAKKIMKTYTRYRRVFARLEQSQKDNLIIDLRTGERLVFVCR